MPFRDKRNKVYDESVSLIADLGFRNRINSMEMGFLLTLLDLVFVNKAKPELITALRKWYKTNNGSEIDEIIKATLIATKLNDQESLDLCIRTIEELLEARQ
ncbi:MAG: hypothetical protein ACOX6E_06755 [Syntrophomonadaceae bacterium]|jgi:hypothetical protein